MTSLAERMKEIESKLNLFDEVNKRGEFNSDMYKEYLFLRGELHAYKKILTEVMNLLLGEDGEGLL